VSQELRNGAEGYPVHALRRGYELRRARLHYSSGAGPRLKLGQASRPPGKISKGSDRAEVGGNGLTMAGTLGRLLRVAGRSLELRASSGKLGAARRRQWGRWPCTRVGFIAARGHGTGVGTGAAEGTRGCACGRALARSRVSAHVEHVVVYFCQCSTAGLVALACRS
jgi:hypothetical protein